MDIDRFWFLTGRHMAGEASPEEEVELLEALSRYPEYKRRYDALNIFWGNSEQRDAVDVEKALLRVKENLETGNEETKKKGNQRSLVTSFFLKIAALLIVGSLVGYIALTKIPARQWTYLTWQEKSNSSGERSEMTLPDGTKVWLNANSKLKFPEKFSLTTREVYLSGEAFFDVAKDASKPFIIHLDRSDIRVLGTSFNVKAFNDEPVIETSVVSGRVAIITTDENARYDTIVLTPNYKATLLKKSGQVLKQKTNTTDDRAWVDGKIIFRSNSLEEVGKVLERTFGKKLLLGSPSLKNCKLTGTFHNNTLEEIIEMISNSKDYQYRITEEEIYLNGMGCQPESN